MKICTEISSLDKLQEIFSTPTTCFDDGDDLPWCYSIPITDTGSLGQGVPVADYLDLLALECKTPKIFVFSVASIEERYLEWLDVAYGTVGATVCEIDRGEYTCYLCCVPSHFPEE